MRTDFSSMQWRDPVGRQPRARAARWRAGVLLLAGLVACSSPAHPPRVEDLLLAAERDLAQRRTESALRIVEEARQLDPTSLRAALMEAAVLAVQKRYERALETLREAQEQHPGAPPLQDAEVAVLRRLGRCQEGVTLVDELLLAAPDSPTLHYEKGELLVAGGRDEARAEFQTARELDPLWWAPYVGEVAVLLERGGRARVREAADLLAAAPPAVQVHRQVRFHRALCAEALDDTATARELYEGLVREFPDDRESWINLGLLYQRSANLEPARAAFRRALDLTSPHEPTLRDQLTRRLEDLSGH